MGKYQIKLEDGTLVDILPSAMKVPCIDCPFHDNGHMAASLGTARMAEITEHATDGGFFPCHKSTGVDGKKLDERIPKELQYRQCAGAIRVKDAAGTTGEDYIRKHRDPNYVRPT